MMAEPMKTLELHYPMIQFLIKANGPDTFTKYKKEKTCLLINMDIPTDRST